MQRRTDFHNLEVGEACIYHEGCLAIDRVETEKVFDKEGNVVSSPNGKGILMKRTRRSIELDHIADIAYAMSNVFVVFERESNGNPIVGTGELQLTQKLIKREWGKRGNPIYWYMAKRIKLPSNITKIC